MLFFNGIALVSSNNNVQSSRKVEDCLTKPANFHFVLQKNSVSLTNVLWILTQGFSCLSKSGSRGRLIWGKQPANIQIGLEKLNSLFYFKIIQKHGKLHHRTIKNILNFVSRNIHQNLPQTWIKSAVTLLFLVRFSRNYHQNVIQSQSLGNLLNLGISVSIWEKQGRLPAPNLS